jgi:reactive intermediate/imine deaminase
MTVSIAVVTTDAPTPAHNFSQGLRRGPLLQVSGQGPVDPATNECLALSDVRGQTIRTLQNIEAILAAAGATFEDVIMFRVYLTAREEFAGMNEAFGYFLEERIPSGVFPARTTVFTGLPGEAMLVEIDALAYLT